MSALRFQKGGVDIRHPRPPFGGGKNKDRKSNITWQKNKTGDSKVESYVSLEISEGGGG